ncbi:MAG: hypothetical protein ACHQUC_06850 [Chlamydiales bacterium]
MVRLQVDQITALVSATHDCFGTTSTIWLFGSRADDTKIGGDIDLYIETDMQSDIVAAKLKMRSLIWKVFGDQKIDILVRSTKEKPSPMHIIAKESGIQL